MWQLHRQGNPGPNLRVTPNSKRAQEIIADRKREDGKKFQMKMFEARIKKIHGRLVRTAPFLKF
jgi:hypothetical protein